MSNNYDNSLLTRILPEFPIEPNSEQMVSTETVSKLYILRDHAKVLTFLDQHPFLIPLLIEANDKIQFRFPNAPLYLRLFTDPDSVGETNLLILITSNYGPEETLKRLDQLDDAWWLATLPGTQGKLSINVEFR